MPRAGAPAALLSFLATTGASDEGWGKYRTASATAALWPTTTGTKIVKMNATMSSE